jgi:16S rRNA (adenine1518-N6/adenine1519-N6)-dimethyltransferase
MSDDVFAKKSLGQHWLDDTASLQAMADAAEINETDTVLEIGSGPGSLTAVLAARAKQVIAVEFDTKLANDLAQRVPVNNLQVIEQDILRFDFNTLPAEYKLAANIPYYLTSNLIRVLSEAANRPIIAALLVQKEVAARAAAQPGDMSLLSVTAQFYWQISLGRIVPAKLFKPPPKVDSQILILRRRPRQLFEVDTKLFFRLVKAGFSQRRKTLLNSLSAGLNLSRDETEAICERASIDCRRRAQSLSLDEWQSLYESLFKT